MQKVFGKKLERNGGLQEDRKEERMTGEKDWRTEQSSPMEMSGERRGRQWTDGRSSLSQLYDHSHFNSFYEYNFFIKCDVMRVTIQIDGESRLSVVMDTTRYFTSKPCSRSVCRDGCDKGTVVWSIIDCCLDSDD